MMQLCAEAGRKETWNPIIQSEEDHKFNFTL